MKKYTCPCCGYKTLEHQPPGTYEICSICLWEDDALQFSEVFYQGGANHVSLVQAQKNFLKFGACEKEMLKHVRKPNKFDEKDKKWKLIEYNNERLDEIIIDVENINTIDGLHEILKDKLNFPYLYGMNWDAFWDAITGLTNMPKKLVLRGWYNIEKRFPKDSRIMKRCLEELNESYPTFKCEVLYK